jgi:hypothetical protein
MNLNLFHEALLAGWMPKCHPSPYPLVPVPLGRSREQMREHRGRRSQGAVASGGMQSRLVAQERNSSRSRMPSTRVGERSVWAITSSGLRQRRHLLLPHQPYPGGAGDGGTHRGNLGCGAWRGGQGLGYRHAPWPGGSITKVMASWYSQPGASSVYERLCDPTVRSLGDSTAPCWKK